MHPSAGAEVNRQLIRLNIATPYGLASKDARTGGDPHYLADT
jgi:hypothetical protein